MQAVKGIQNIGIMCHAPIVMDQFSRDDRHLVREIHSGMQSAAQNLTQFNPHTMIIVSPHVARLPNQFTILKSPTLEGNFSQFGHNELHYQYKANMAGIQSILKMAPNSNIEIKTIDAPLDHGTLVPLDFIQATGWIGQLIVIGFPYYPEISSLKALGKIIQNSSIKLDQSWALVCSGDMSHRLKPGAPAGFHPEAQKFDAILVQAVKNRDISKTMDIPNELRDLAAEDIIDSIVVGIGTGLVENENIEFLAYEAPFGVGYMAANLL